MCNECHMLPCHPRCPNNNEDEHSGIVCDSCNEEVERGDSYYVFANGEIVCAYCIDDLSREELAERMNAEARTVK